MDEAIVHLGAAQPTGRVTRLHERTIERPNAPGRPEVPLEQRHEKRVYRRRLCPGDETHRCRHALPPGYEKAGAPGLWSRAVFVAPGADALRRSNVALRNLKRNKKIKNEIK